MGKNKVIFLDRDGTINVNKGYVYKKEDFELIDGVIEGLTILQNLGFKFIVISNQSGIARGFYKVEDAENLFNYMIECFKKFNINISKYYYCPHLYECCDCRKPKLGLFYKAQKEFNIDFKNSYAIGDNIRDVSVCKQEPVKGFIISEDNKFYSNNVIQCTSFLIAAKKIEDMEREKNGNDNTI